MACGYEKLCYQWGKIPAPILGKLCWFTPTDKLAQSKAGQSSSTVSILGHHHAGSSVCVNSVVTDVNKASLKKLILQLKCEVVLNFVHLALRASQVDRKIRSSFPVLALPAGATFL